MITKVIPEEKVVATYKAIQRARRIVIVAHKRPDGDAIGSCLGLYHFLYAFERETFVILPDAIPSNMTILPSSSEIINYEQNVEHCKAIIAETDLIFCLDFNNLERIGALGTLIAQSEAEKIMIDHHLDYQPFADVCISHPEIASTSELIFRLICRMGYFADMSLQTAECICAGMLTDTGGLAYNSNSPEIYTIFAELLRKGVDKDALYRHLFNTYKESRMRLMGYVLSQKLEIIPECHTALFSLTEEELKQYNYEKGDTEGFVNLPLSIDGIIFSIFAREEKDTVKLSLRSVGNFPANKFASHFFEGGGHLNASGAESKLSLQETIDKIKQVLPDFCKSESW
ncbi:MAG: bifunctional oligoribonuclease/PAP phosphatase NrnA [Paludibacteraceae bacterium]|nr:bifunctional oligoribonuclease/PAP phosphatase NrnA [Paludibacteraceae bacterium]